MPTESEKARDVVAQALTELGTIMDAARASGSVDQMMASLERWKRRTVEDLGAYISEDEARRFSTLRIHPSWVNMETIDGPLARHESFLFALLEDLERVPGRTIAVSSSAIPREMAGKPFIFLSHAAVDVALAEYIEETLRDAIPNHEVFRTTRVGQIPSGYPWFQHIADHLRGAAKYIVLLTPASQTRTWISFETGAAWMTSRTMVLALGGGLSAGDVVEPLRNLQLLSVEVGDEAAEVFSRLGGRLENPDQFARQARELGAVGRVEALRAAGWEQIEFEGRTYAWDGPLEELTEGQGVPLPDGLPNALRANGMIPTTTIPGDLLNKYSKGYQRVWHIDARMRKRAVISKDSQILLVKPEK